MNWKKFFIIKILILNILVSLFLAWNFYKNNSRPHNAALSAPSPLNDEEKNLKTKRMMKKNQIMLKQRTNITTLLKNGRKKL